MEVHTYIPNGWEAVQGQPGLRWPSPKTYTQQTNKLLCHCLPTKFKLKSNSLWASKHSIGFGSHLQASFTVIYYNPRTLPLWLLLKYGGRGGALPNTGHLNVLLTLPLPQLSPLLFESKLKPYFFQDVIALRSSPSSPTHYLLLPSKWCCRKIFYMIMWFFLIYSTRI